MIHLDTHVAVWIHDGRTKKIPQSARRLIEHELVGLSPVALLEYEVLFELGRVDTPTTRFVHELEEQLDLRQSDTSLGAVVAQARTFAWTRDPYDRLIVANAIADGARLLTADTHILAHFNSAVWD